MSDSHECDINKFYMKIWRRLPLRLIVQINGNIYANGSEYKLKLVQTKLMKLVNKIWEKVKTYVSAEVGSSFQLKAMYKCQNKANLLRR
ncbi:MAG: hypothetical protein ACTS44_01470 [Candidatus Hodgkinia cicadicola]